MEAKNGKWRKQPYEPGFYHQTERWVPYGTGTADSHCTCHFKSISLGPTFKFGQILLIDAATHILVVVLLMVVAVAAVTVGRRMLVMMTVGVRLHTGVVREAALLAVGIEPQPVPGVGVGAVVRHGGGGSGRGHHLPAPAAAPSARHPSPLYLLNLAPLAHYRSRVGLYNNASVGFSKRLQSLEEQCG
jgi:hypothetical protein